MAVDHKRHLFSPAQRNPNFHRGDFAEFVTPSVFAPHHPTANRVLFKTLTRFLFSQYQTAQQVKRQLSYFHQ